MAPSTDSTGRKAELREAFKSRRVALTPSEIAAASYQIAERVMALLGDASCVGVFAGIRGEVDLPVDVLARDGRTLAWPRCESGRGAMRFIACTDRPQTLGKYGVPEPRGAAVIAPEAFDAIIVPGLAFDARGRRLGQGGGYYDRYLPKLRDDALRVGVCYAWQVVDALVTERHDVTMTHVITETETWSASG